MPLQEAQITNLRQIMREEYVAAQTTWHEISGESPQAMKQRLQTHLDARGERILGRAGGVLDERQNGPNFNPGKSETAPRPSSDSP